MDVWLEGGSEKGGDGEGDGENEYFWLPGPVLMGRGDGGVGGDEDGETRPFLISAIEYPSVVGEFCIRIVLSREFMFEF